jgi:hypothetical protein
LAAIRSREDPFCVESDNDRVIYSRLVEKLAGEPIVIHKGEYAVREGGFVPALMLAHRVTRNAFRAGADAVVLAVDNDGSESLHSSVNHLKRDEHCRWCSLHFAANAAEVQRWAKAEGRSFEVIVGVPVQTLETWLLLANDYPFPGPPEALGRDATGRASLKRALYGTPRPDSTLMRERALPLIERLDVAAVLARSESFRHFAEQVAALRPA